LRQHDLAKRIALWRRLTGGEMRAMADRVAKLIESGQGGVFDDRFVQAAHGRIS
jgi:hypothetical protein